MNLEDQIRALLEANKDDAKDTDTDQQADRVDVDPAVKIENPMNPDLTSSEGGIEPQDEIAAGEKQGAGAGCEPNDPNCQDADDDEDDSKKKVDESVEIGSISDLLEDIELTDEFKLKAQTIFEAAVKDQVMKIQATLQEEHKAAVAGLETQFEEKFVARSKQLEEETSDKIDGYLSFLAESWKQDNAVALESGIRSELVESFIDNMKTLFEQHYVDLPEEKVDLYSQTLNEKAELETALATTVSTVAKLTEEVNQFKREQIIEEASKDFSSLDQARFKTLTEDFAFEDVESFKTKVNIVKGSFFGQKQSTAKEQLTEEFSSATPIVEETPIVENVIEQDPTMSRYVQALSKK